MNLDETHPRAYQRQGHGDKSAQTTCQSNKSPPYWKSRRVQAQMEDDTPSCSPPFPPNANFFLHGSKDTTDHGKNSHDPGIDLSISPQPICDKATPRLPFDVEKPTCSINLLCRRNGILQKHQIHVISQTRCSSQNQFENLIANNKNLIQTDTKLFEVVKRTYQKKMYGIWRRIFSLKTLREIRLVLFTPSDYRPVPALVPESVKQDILFAYWHPEKLLSNDEWIQWIFNLRQPSRRYSLEFVEGWSALRILIAVSIILVFSTAIGITWAVVKQDTQTGFTIASFVLGAGSLLLAALATVSGIEAPTSDQSGQTQQHNMKCYHAHAHESVDMSPFDDFITEASRKSDRLVQLKKLEQLSKRQQARSQQNQSSISTTSGIEKAKKGKRVHACGFPGCNKVFTQQEHRRRHELNHWADMGIDTRFGIRDELLASELHSLTGVKPGGDKGDTGRLEAQW